MSEDEAVIALASSNAAADARTVIRGDQLEKPVECTTGRAMMSSFLRPWTPVLPWVGTAVSIRWRNRRTTLQSAQWASLEDQGWTLAILGRDRGDILVGAERGDERASLRLRKDGTVDDMSAEQPVARVATPSIRYLSDSDVKARKLGY